MQAKWGAITAKNDFISRGNDILEIMQFMTSLECESDMLSAYTEIANLENQHLDDAQIELKIKQIINRYRQKQNNNIPRGMSDMFPIEEDGDVLVTDYEHQELLLEEGYSRKANRLIKVKSIRTLPNGRGIRRKDER